ncbi:hypothetical protein XELAEV_18008448mg [Xenopus laevis]|uniref:Uncharacterized protein n=1 Tax=Xenopus laevis TaxID=8355 RepID=A0A974E4N3_XENLA|nr:hypothetical protein XELAEV_18008448mg [Xenopus laevis]
MAAPIATVYINYSRVSESNTPVVPVQGNSTLCCHYFKTITFFVVTVPLRSHNAQLTHKSTLSVVCYFLLQMSQAGSAGAGSMWVHSHLHLPQIHGVPCPPQLPHCL